MVARNASGPDLFQDPSGRLHALWAESSGLRYRYATSTANTAWSAPQTLVTGDSFAFKRLAVNAAGNGWAVWVGGAGVRAVPLSRATIYTGPTRGVQTTGFGGAYTLGVPRRCVSPGQRFRVTPTWRRQRRKGNLFVKVRRSDFYLGSRVIKRDTRVPFVHTYRVTVTQRPGSTITLRARAFIKVRRGKEPKKSIRAGFVAPHRLLRPALQRIRRRARRGTRSGACSRRPSCSADARLPPARHPLVAVTVDEVVHS